MTLKEPTFLKHYRLIQAMIAWPPAWNRMPENEHALRFLLGLVNSLADELAAYAGKPVPDVLEYHSKLVESDAYQSWVESGSGPLLGEGERITNGHSKTEKPDDQTASHEDGSHLRRPGNNHRRKRSYDPMSKCQTCNHPLTAVAPDRSWCVRCGSLHYPLEGVVVWPPDIVKRVREFADFMNSDRVVSDSLRTCGVSQCVEPEED